MKAHGIDGRLNVLMAGDSVRNGAGLACRLQRDRLPIAFGFFDRGLTGVLRASGQVKGGDQRHGDDHLFHGHSSLLLFRMGGERDEPRCAKRNASDGTTIHCASGERPVPIQGRAGIKLS